MKITHRENGFHELVIAFTVEEINKIREIFEDDLIFTNYKGEYNLVPQGEINLNRITKQQMIKFDKLTNNSLDWEIYLGDEGSGLELSWK